MTGMSNETNLTADSSQDTPHLDNPLMSGPELWKALGYRTGTAFSQAARRGMTPVSVFHIPGRRGQHALRADVMAWVANLSQMAKGPLSSNEDKEAT
jgi:hypothetical protein